MNARTLVPSTAEPAGSLLDLNRSAEAKRFRSLALSQRRHSHRYRQWAQESADLGHRAAAEGFTRSADRYAADALWYWVRSRREPIQIGSAS